ncbi:hypothetical protein LLE87_40075, partial [Paenibacillus polymyxa]|nr:hypothetical protein [Paenibacillus polymyxa]
MNWVHASQLVARYTFPDVRADIGQCKAPGVPKRRRNVLATRRATKPAVDCVRRAKGLLLRDQF